MNHLTNSPVKRQVQAAARSLYTGIQEIEHEPGTYNAWENLSVEKQGHWWVLANAAIRAYLLAEAREVVAAAEDEETAAAPVVMKPRLMIKMREGFTIDQMDKP